MKHIHAYLLLLLVTVSCNVKAPSGTIKTKHSSQQIALPPPGKPITIFIHGGAKPLSSFLQFIGFNDACPRGFHLIRQIDCDTCLGKKVGLALNIRGSAQYPLSAFYVFGWSGYLSFEAREKAGRELYDFLSLLRSTPGYETVPLTIIGYSHGGNVALAAAMTAWEKKDYRLLVNSLVTMACPVVLPTECFITAPTFGTIVALYSKSDSFQVFDPQGLYTDDTFSCPFFSQRRFDASPRLVQAEAKIRGKSRTGHLGFISKRFLTCLPEVIDLLNDKTKTCRMIKDHHGAYCVNVDTRNLTVNACCPKHR